MCIIQSTVEAAVSAFLVNKELTIRNVPFLDREGQENIVNSYVLASTETRCVA